MAVIINELEVIVETPPTPAGTGGEMPASTRPPSPQEIAAVLERRARYDLRRLAH
jgi:hypothetical protein